MPSERMLCLFDQRVDFSDGTVDSLDVHLTESAAETRGGRFGIDKPAHEAAAGARTTGY